MQNEIWDVVIVGAGPAGSVAAALLASRGWRVLLLERAKWPREKVCGGCVNAAAVEMLRSAGLGGVLRAAHAARLDRFVLNVVGRGLTLPLPEGVSIPRALLDAGIVEEAVRRGCVFVSGASASVLPAVGAGDVRAIRVVVDGAEQIVRARVVLACDGIGGTSLEQEPWAQWTVAGNAWMGISTTLREASGLVGGRTIAMRVGSGGYVGAARYEDGSVHVAAAVDSSACRTAGGPARLVENILRECGADVPAEIGAARFQGTGLLTRRRAVVGGHRVLAMGDACGYVEPFTGEGIAWAIRGAMEAVDLLPASMDVWPTGLEAAWGRRHRATIGAQQRLCRVLRRSLRYPSLAKWGVAAAGLVPAFAESIAERIGRHSFCNVQPLQGVGE